MLCRSAQPYSPFEFARFTLCGGRGGILCRKGVCAGDLEEIIGIRQVSFWDNVRLRFYRRVKNYFEN